MSTELKQRIGRRVSAARNDARLSQEQLAEKIGRSAEAISNIERGVSLPTLETLERISGVLEHPLNFLVGGAVATGSPHRVELEAQAHLVLRALSDRDLKMAVGMLQVIRDGGGRSS